MRERERERERGLGSGTQTSRVIYEVDCMSVHSPSTAPGSPRALKKAGGTNRRFHEGIGTKRRRKKNLHHQRGCAGFGRRDAGGVSTAAITLPQMSPLARDALSRLRAESDGIHHGSLASGNDDALPNTEMKKKRRRRRLILGSGSASRRALLENAGLKDFDVAVPEVDELVIGVKERETNQSETLVKLLAETKCDALIDRGVGTAEGDNEEIEDDVLLLTGDSVVTYHEAIREKPQDITQARDFISSYSNDCCTTVSAVCVHNLRTGERRMATHRTTVHFNEISPEVIDALCEDGQVLKCAGGLMVEHPLVETSIDRIEGGIDAVMGLCIATVLELMESLAS